ncbi:MAG: C1 family peptidase [Anaerolineaceae bacterium]
MIMNSGVVYAQGGGVEETQTNTVPSIMLGEPQQNIIVTQGDKVSIVWEDEDPDDNAMIDIAYDVDNDPVNEENYHWIIQGLSEDLDGDGDRYEWDTTGVAAGTYYVWASIGDSTNAPVYALAAGTVTIQEVQVPMEEPTSEPPQAPIEEPTAAPTEEPTMEPTAVPTEIPTLEPAQTPTPEPTEDAKFYWKLEIVGISPQMDAYNAVIQKLSSGENELEASSESIVIQGSRGMGEIREVLYTKLDGVINLIGGVAEIDLEIPIKSKEPIDILLESNLSTGYRWAVVSAKNEGEEIKFTERYTAREGIGVPFIQTITLHPTSAGIASIRLLYLRSFEKGAEVTRRLTIQLNTEDSIIDLSDPSQSTYSESAYYPENSIESDLDSADYIESDLDYADTLPSSFDWRDHAGVTPIRNQQSCGSCWAFAAVGAMESAIAIRTGQYVDLSEQFLVSCNYDGWNCESGGGTAHKYHYDTLGKNQIQVGAVLEADKPYTNSDSTCTVAYNHPYILSNWNYVSSATVENIKSAIYTYGPVKVSICAGPAFQDYRGGIFSTNEASYCTYGTNHAVNLVGWDDANGTWILRNSWGTWWGESGYMNIRYGISNVGSMTSWVSYPPNTVLPAPISPSETISDNTPTYTWSRVNGATRYQYQLYKGGSLVYAKTVSGDGCGTTTCTSTPSDVLSVGDYQWRVCAYIDGVWRSASAFKNFTLSLPIPDPISPSGTITDTTPTYTWSIVSGATRYQYQLYKSTTLVYAKTVTSSGCSTTTCSSTPVDVLSTGDYQWRVCAYVDGVWRSASAFTNFSLSFPVPAPISPNGTISDTTPTYIWSKINGATRYQYQLYNGSTLIYAKTVTSDVCGTTNCSNTPTTVLSVGDYQWRVCAYVDGVWRSASAFMSFTLSLTPTPISPSDTITDTNPTYIWSKVSGATRYQVQLYSGTTLIYARTVTSSVCGTTTCSNTPTTVLSAGDYQWRVCAYVDEVWRSASAFKSFTLST